jgi:hypothetical protein
MPRMTYEDAIGWIVGQPRWAWSAPWWRTGEIIVMAAGRVWSVRDPAALLPPRAELLGCTPVNHQGHAGWIGWDLDVGEHGTTSYTTTEAAIIDARRLREALDGRAEIRTSKSGSGIHVRTILEPTQVPAAEAVKIARTMAARLALRADATPLGRQAFWLWARTPKPGAFKLIEPHAGLEAQNAEPTP